jgi:hypothetical protein
VIPRYDEVSMKHCCKGRRETYDESIAGLLSLSVTNGGNSAGQLGDQGLSEVVGSSQLILQLCKNSAGLVGLLEDGLLGDQGVNDAIGALGELGALGGELDCFGQGHWGGAGDLGGASLEGSEDGGGLAVELNGCGRNVGGFGEALDSGVKGGQGGADFANGRQDGGEVLGDWGCENAADKGEGEEGGDLHIERVCELLVISIDCTASQATCFTHLKIFCI